MSLLHEAKVLLGKALSGFHAGDKKMLSHQPSIDTADNVLALQSDAFSDGSPIPITHAGTAAGGQNVSPGLQISNVPSSVKSLALVVEDPDAPFPQPFVHWVIYNIPPQTQELPQGIPVGQTPIANSILRQAKNSNREFGYTGPVPPPGHGVHHYHFQLFALDQMLTLPEHPSHKDLFHAFEHHVLAFGEMVGTYERE